MRVRPRTFALLGLGIVLVLGGEACVPRASAAPWRQDRFLIGGWMVNDAPLDPKRLVMMQDAGLDYVQNQDHGGLFRFGKLLVTQLDSLRRVRPDFKLQAVLHYSRPEQDVGRFTQNVKAEAQWDAIRRNLRPGGGANSPSVLGWCLWDEPCSRADMASIGALTRALRNDAATSGGIAYVNLFPLAHSGAKRCFDGVFTSSKDRHETYRAYLEAYLSQFDGDPDPAQALSFDNYPHIIPGRFVDTWLDNLSLAAEAARAHSRPGKSIPLWVVIQLSPYKVKGKPWPDTPTPAQTRWQAWTALAYGVRSISYYTIGPVFDPRLDEGWGPGILEYSGKTTKRWDEFRRLNGELHAVGGPLFAATWNGAWRSDQGSVPEANDWGLRDVTSDAKTPAVVGAYAMPSGAQRYLLAVNQDLDRSASIRVRLRGTADLVERIDRQTGKATVLARGVTEFKLPAVPAATAELIRVTPRG